MLGFDSDEYRVNTVCDMLFPPEYLAKVNERDPKKRTNRETFQEVSLEQSHPSSLATRAVLHVPDTPVGSRRCLPSVTHSHDDKHSTAPSRKYGRCVRRLRKCLLR